MPQPKELTAINNIIPQITQLISSTYRHSSQTLKSDNSIVTQTDKDIDQLIHQTLSNHFPQDHILSEELDPLTPLSNHRTWIIDPICGTSNFAQGVNYFNTNISLWQGSDPVFSLVIDHPNHTYYWAHNSLDQIFEQDQPYQLTRPQTHERIIDIDVFGYFIDSTHLPQDKITAINHTITQLQSQGIGINAIFSSLSCTYAALGIYDGCIMDAAKPWDMAAAAHLSFAQNGLATDFSGQTWHPGSPNLIASLKPQIHTMLHQLINSLS